MKKFIKTSLLSIVLFGGAITTSAFLCSTIDNVEQIKKANEILTTKGELRNTSATLTESEAVDSDRIVDDYFLFPTQANEFNKWDNEDQSSLTYESRWFLWNEPTVDVNDEGNAFNLTLSYAANTESEIYDQGKDKYLGAFSKETGEGLYRGNATGASSPLAPYDKDSTESSFWPKTVKGYSIHLKKTPYLGGESEDVWYSADSADDFVSTGGEFIINNLELAKYEIVDVLFGYESFDGGTAWARAGLPDDSGQIDYWGEDDSLSEVDPRSAYDFAPVIDEDSFVWNKDYVEHNSAQFNLDISTGTGDLTYQNAVSDVTLTADAFNEDGIVSTDNVLTFDDEYDDSITDNSYVTHTFTVNGITSGLNYDNLEFTSTLNTDGNAIIGSPFESEAIAPEALISSNDSSNTLFTGPTREFYDYAPVIDPSTFVWNSEYQTNGKVQFSIDISSGTGALNYDNITDLGMTVDSYKDGELAEEAKVITDITDSYEKSDSNDFENHTFTIGGIDAGYQYDNLKITSSLDTTSNQIMETAYADEAVAPEAEVISTDLPGDAGDYGYLFESAEYSKPIINSSFMFTDIKADSATFSFDVYVTDEPEDDGVSKFALKEDDNSLGGDGFYYFDPSEDVYLLQGTETDKGLTFVNTDDYGVEFDHWVDVTDTEGTDADGTIYDTYTLFYKVDGLTPNTDYSNFGLFIDAWEDADRTTAMGNQFKDLNEPTTANDPEFLTLYSITDFRGAFKTPHQIIYYITVIIILLLILLAIGIVALVIYGLMWWHKHISMAIYVDAEDSHASGDLILNLVHAQRHSEIWNAHEEDLILYAEGREIDAVFRRDHTVKGGFKIYVTEDGEDGRHSFVSIMQAEKYDNFTIGIEEKEWHAFAITDKKAKQIAKAHERKVKNIYYDIRKDVLDEMDNNYSKSATTSEHGIIAHVSHKKSKEDKLRFQLILPREGHPLTDEFDPESNKLVFYHLYDGKLYKIDHKYIGTYGSMIEWDFINLAPGSIYVGISYSIDGGKTIYPSSAVYGITTDEEGHLHSKTDAKLAAPIDSNAKGIKIWKRGDANEYLGDEAFESLCSIVVKKHYEKDNENVFLSADRAQEYYDEYIDLWLADAEKKTTTTAKKSTTTKKATTTETK